jgi:hypothetical protein
MASPSLDQQQRDFENDMWRYSTDFRNTFKTYAGFFKGKQKKVFKKHGWACNDVATKFIQHAPAQWNKGNTFAAEERVYYFCTEHNKAQFDIWEVIGELTDDLSTEGGDVKLAGGLEKLGEHISRMKLNLEEFKKEFP